MKTVNEDDRAYFNHFQDGYNPYSERDLERIIRPLDRIIHNKENMIAAEIGCASGQFSRLMGKRHANLRLVGIDIAEKALAGYPYEKTLASVFELPLPDNCIDIVCLPAALHHFFPFDKSLIEIERIIKPGGWLYCLEPNFFHPQRRFLMRFSRLYRLYRKANDVPIRPDRLASMLSGMGFEVEHFEFMNLFFRNPSLLQRIQNTVYLATPRSGMDKHLLPWFLLLARKREK